MWFWGYRQQAPSHPLYWSYWRDEHLSYQKKSRVVWFLKAISNQLHLITSFCTHETKCPFLDFFLQSPELKLFFTSPNLSHANLFHKILIILSFSHSHFFTLIPLPLTLSLSHSTPSFPLWGAFSLTPHSMFRQEIESCCLMRSADLTLVKTISFCSWMCVLISCSQAFFSSALITTQLCTCCGVPSTKAAYRTKERRHSSV